MKRKMIFLFATFMFLSFLFFTFDDVYARPYLTDIESVDIVRDYSIRTKELNTRFVKNSSYLDSNQPSIEIDLEKDYGIKSLERIYWGFRTYVFIVQVDITSISNNAQVGVYYYSPLSDKSLLTNPYIGRPLPHHNSNRYEFYGEVDKDAFTTNRIRIGFAGVNGTFEVSNVQVQLCLAYSKPKLKNIVYVTNGVYIG